MKLLTAIYKTYEGARKRCAFEFQRGEHYPFAPTPGQPDRCEHCALPFMDHYNGECPK